jgi:hypothetical protein
MQDYALMPVTNAILAHRRSTDRMLDVAMEFLSTTTKSPTDDQLR